MLPVETEPTPESDEPDRQRAARAKVGSTLHGKWHLNALLAVGGMGAVYDATHRNGMRAAVKILSPGLSQSVSARKRFLREGRLANRVRHPGAVRVLDDDEAEDGSAYLVMELLSGETLDALAARGGGKIEAAKAVEYGLQILDTLAQAHASGIVHRDIKPENLFLTDDGTVKILDFGIAGVAAVEGASTLTKAGDVIGTPAFMAPEQARGRWELVDRQSDLYSLGASLFSLLTGRLVHDKAGTVAELLVLTITEKAPSLAVAMPGAPEALVLAIDGALALGKAQRWADAATMRSALEEGYLALTGNSAPPARAPLPTDPGMAISTSERVRRMIQTMPAEAVAFIAGPREVLLQLVTLKDLIDVVIPRGGEELKELLSAHSRVPVIAAAGGNCHVYVDAAADLDMALAITVNAKCQRPGVCNAAETLLVHHDVAAAFLPRVVAELTRRGVELAVDRATAELVPDPRLKRANRTHYETEFLDLKMAVRVVGSLDEAIDHVTTFGSGHSEAIVTGDLEAAQRFTREVDAAVVYVNASTRFTDGGQFGLGAEMGISTQKLHARGPISLRELTCQKYVAWGDGQVRS